MPAPTSSSASLKPSERSRAASGTQQLLAGVGALGDLEHDLLGLVAGAAHGEHEAVAGERVVLERLRRHVEEQQRALRQVGGGAQRRAAADGVELVAAADRVGDLERLAGAGQLGACAGARAPRSRARGCRPRSQIGWKATSTAPASISERTARTFSIVTTGTLSATSVEATTALPPRRLASSSAASARPHSELGSRSSARAALKPMLAVTPDRRFSTVARMRSSGTSASHSVVWASSSANSSPPRRNARSPARCSRSSSASSHSRRSPCWWPWRSFSNLKSSMSSSASVIVAAVARGLADRAGELVLERAVVVEVGQAVAARALQRRAVEHADAAAAEHVEERQRDQQAEQHEQREAVAERRRRRSAAPGVAVLGEQRRRGRAAASA